MNSLTALVGAVVEAWSEVKAQKTRVILSLIGVVVAVTAMTTVIAWGEIMVQSQQEMNDAYSGRPVTLSVGAHKESDSSDQTPEALYQIDQYGMLTEAKDGESQPEVALMDDEVPTPLVGGAMATVAKRFSIPYWARAQWGNLPMAFMDELMSQGTFHSQPVPAPEYGYQPPQITAVDPDYATIYRLVPLQGRWLSDNDWRQRLTPVVINESLWKMLGSPDIQKEPLLLDVSLDPLQQMRVVGLCANQSRWDAPAIFVSYDSWQFLAPSGGDGEETTMLVWTDPAQVEEARVDLPRALAATLGEGWGAEAYGGESWEGDVSTIRTLQLAVLGIGALVIALGALGLLNVAVVTVRQRKREIGIRRAMGASSTRVFFAVFMESVAATFVAGIIGVGLAIVIVRFVPLEALGIFLQDPPAFPIRAGLSGVLIATGVGAICGLIPAISAVRVAPIEAIRS